MDIVSHAIHDAATEQASTGNSTLSECEFTDIHTNMHQQL